MDKTKWCEAIRMVAAQNMETVWGRAPIEKRLAQVIAAKMGQVLGSNRINRLAVLNYIFPNRPFPIHSTKDLYTAEAVALPECLRKWDVGIDEETRTVLADIFNGLFREEEVLDVLPG